MITTVLLVFATIQCALLAYSFGWQSHAPLRLWLLRAILFGMVCDNITQAIGPWGVGTDWYVIANYPRFFFHATLLPLLTLFTLSILVDAKISFANNTFFRGCMFLFTACALAYGIFHDVITLELEAVSSLGHPKLSSVSKLPPIATILTNILMLPLAIVIWRKAKWPWLFAGSIFIFVLNGATGPLPWGFLAGNFGEVVFIFALLTTERHFSKPQSEQP
jgi:hypothetical protein